MSTIEQEAITAGEAEGARFRRAYLILLSFTGAALLIWLLSGFYTVGTDQVAIVERLGEYQKTPAGDIEKIGYGLHYHLPWPIDRVSVISTQQIFTMKVSAFNASPAEYDNFKREWLRQGARPEVINALFDPYLITGDKNVVHADMTVQFRITDPGAWLTSVSHEYHQTYTPEAAEDMRNTLFQNLAQRELLDAVAHMTLDGVMRDSVAELQRNLVAAMQHAMKIHDPADPTGKTLIDTGITVDSVAISPPRVPDAVKPAFDNLVTQKAVAVTKINQAQAQAQSLEAKATGQKQSLIADANGDASNTVQAAKGEADRFRQVYAQYQNAPDVTRINLLNDAMQAVTGSAKRIFFVQPGQRSLIVVDPPQVDVNQGRTGN
jgi:modulator of FtsH protease HflK